MISFEEFCRNRDALLDRVAKAAVQSGRNAADIKILPVTKTHPLDAAEFSARAGWTAVGENKVQEACQKIAQAAASADSPAKPLEWELIGHLQTNKAKKAVENFARIQSVDSMKLLEKIDAEAAKIGKVQRVLLQINAGRDPAKFGAEIEDAPALLEAALKLGNTAVEGLMTIAPLDDANPDTARRTFAKLREIRDALSQQFGANLPELSMGMTHDLECAIAEGSTMIRVGTFLFGARNYAV